jgi:ubiquinone/menaquinone biosynthesis C-methylase UbiE
MSAEPRYIPAARWQIFSRLYDPVLALAMQERRFRDSMLERVDADLPNEGTAVDVGCGTGTFGIALASRRADAKVIGIDGDSEILALARAKGPGDIPLANESADVVTMSLVLHHLLPEDKRRALREVRRVLKPGGRFHVADWGEPHDPVMSVLFFVAQAIDGFDRTRDHRAGRLPSLIAKAGLS